MVKGFVPFLRMGVRMNRLRHALPFAATLVAAVPVSAQAIWLPVATPTAPPPREHAKLVHDYLRDRLVLWGGQGSGGGGFVDTWEFDGSAWQQRSTAHTPNGYGQGAMAYDRGRGRVVLVTANAGQGETWEYDGTDWLHRSLAADPPASGNDLLVYDGSRGLCVLFVQGYGSGSAETWEYDGYAWTHRYPTSSPPARYDAGMAFDPLRGRTILYGGVVSSGPPWITWEYDGANWTAGPNAAASPDRNDFAFTFDANRRRAVLFGGLGYPYTTATYEYEAPNWTLRTTVGPSNRTGAAMAYDLGRQQCVLFGGRDTASNIVMGDTFVYRSLVPATATTFGQGCAGSSIAPGFLPQPYHVPYTGMNFGVRLYSAPYNQPSLVVAGFSRTSFAGQPLPLPLGFLGMTNCELLVSVDVSAATTTNGSNATLAFPIPAQPTLAGAAFYLQAFALDIGGNPANLINTRAIECHVGVP